MIKHLVPREYKSLLDYISPSVFRVVDWKTAKFKFFALSKRALSNSSLEELAKSNLKLFSPTIIITKKKKQSPEKKNITDLQFSESILDIYFSQFFSNKGTLLDLRIKHFGVRDGYVYFNPGPFVHIFDQEFRAGMLQIYEGYYLDKSDLLVKGMLAVGLLKSLQPSEIEETKKLLFSHFGEADQGFVEFDLEHFKSSFHNLFLHLSKKKIRLSSDFIFLGVYLVTLYLSLSKIGQAVDVKKCFIESWSRNSKR